MQRRRNQVIFESRSGLGHRLKKSFWILGMNLISGWHSEVLGSKNNTQYFYLYSIKKFLKGTILGFNRILDWGSKKSSEFNPWDDEIITSEGLTAILTPSIPHYTATYKTNKHYISPACTTYLVQLPTRADRAFFLDLSSTTKSFEFLILSRWDFI